jgi:cytosine/adenosine deaminase-related metal-dependent hydrolase
VIINNACLVSLWPNEPVVEGALIAIEGKTIVDFGKVGKLVDRYDHPEVVDVGGRLVLPGLVDAHARLDRSLAVGAPGGLSRELPPSALDPGTLYWSAMVALLDAVRSGVTALFVASPGGDEPDARVDALRRAFTEVGLKGTLAHVPPRGGNEGIAAARIFATGAASAGASMRGLVGLRVDAALDEDLLLSSVEISREVDARLHLVLEPGAAPFAKRLERAGALSRGGLLACRSALDEEDEIVLRDHDVWVVHLARAAVVDGVETSNLGRAASARIKVALGTDGTGGGTLEEFRFAALRDRSQGRPLADAVALAFRAAFHGNPDLAAATFGRELGRIKPGASADLVVVDHRPATPLEAVNVADHLFRATPAAPVHSVVVNGRPLVQNHRFVALDEERIRARAREAAHKLWERL